jgi:chromosome segregation ATPase
MNEFGKICVVFVTAASLGFVAFAGALRSGGRNWQAEMDELGTDFLLNTTVGERTTYTLTHRRSNQAVSSNTKVLAEAVVAGKAKQVSEMRDEMNSLTKQTEDLKPLAEAALKAIAADEDALKRRGEALSRQLDQVMQQISRVNSQIIEAANEAQKIRSEGQERREEVYRLRNQLELLRNDLSVAQVQRKNLEEEEVRLREILQRLERRKQQLSGTTDQEYDNQQKSSESSSDRG